MFDFAKCRLDDAEIYQVVASGDKLFVKFRDWQEKEHQLVFEEVAGYQWFSAEGRALSHGTVEEQDPFLTLACEMADEDSTAGFKVYSFVSAWNDEKILRVVAKAVAMAALSS